MRNMFQITKGFALKGYLLGVLTSDLAKASAVLFSSSMFGGILGYVYQILMGKMLSIAEYGLFVTLMALLSLFGVPLSAISMVVTRKASEYRASNSVGLMASLFWWINKRILVVSVLLLICLLPFTGMIGSYFHLDSHAAVWITILIALVALFIPINNAILQALQYFGWLAFNGVATHAMKIFFCVCLILLGLGLEGALLGVLLAYLSIWVLSYWPIRGIASWRQFGAQTDEHIQAKGIFPVFLANLAYTIMTQLDIILVNQYFPPQEAGVYAVAAVLGKAVMYLPGAIAIAMFPMVAENESRSHASLSIFTNAMLLTAGLSGAGALFYYWFSGEVISILYAQKYAGAAELLKLYGFAMLPMAFVMVAEHFLIAKGRVIFAYVMITSIPFILLAAQAFHDQMASIVYILIISGWGLLGVGFCVLAAQYWVQQRNPAGA